MLLGQHTSGHPRLYEAKHLYYRVRADLADVDLDTVRAAAATGDVEALIQRAELAERQRARSAERAQREAAQRVRAAELQTFREARAARRAAVGGADINPMLERVQRSLMVRRLLLCMVLLLHTVLLLTLACLTVCLTVVGRLVCGAEAPCRAQGEESAMPATPLETEALLARAAEALGPDYADALGAVGNTHTHTQYHLQLTPQAPPATMCSALPAATPPPTPLRHPTTP